MWSNWKAHQRHTLTGVWVEITSWFPRYIEKTSHPHGCVSWNLPIFYNLFNQLVTPSRVCELKWPCRQWHGSLQRHTLTGVWVEISNFGGFWMEDLGHTLTGVWVEIPKKLINKLYNKWSHPHGCVSWNLISYGIYKFFSGSHPHGCVSWNSPIRKRERLKKVTPSRVCELKYYPDADGNINVSHTLTGVWVEIHNLLRGRPPPTSGGVTPSRVCELKLGRWL